MQLVEEGRGEYVERLLAIRSWVHELAQDLARSDLSVEIDAEGPAFIRTSHMIRIRSDAGEQALVLTKEEFWNEFDLFERNAVPRLREAIEKLRSDEQTP